MSRKHMLKGKLLGSLIPSLFTLFVHICSAYVSQTKTITNLVCYCSGLGHTGSTNVNKDVITLPIVADFPRNIRLKVC